MRVARIIGDGEAHIPSTILHFNLLSHQVHD